MTTNQLVSRHAYEHLPLIYDAAGFSDYATEYTSRLLEFLHENGWIGRQVLDLGCGTGASSSIFADVRLAVTGVDSSAGMIAKAQARFQGSAYDVRFEHTDIRTYTGLEGTYDLVYCLDTLNYLSGVKDLEVVFQQASTALQKDKTFLFDLETVEGLAAYPSEQVLHRSSGIFVTTTNLFDYETLSLQKHITFFAQRQDGLFDRFEETHVLRSYPVKGLLAVLRRVGFEVEHLLNPDFTPYEGIGKRVVIIAHKTA